MDKNAYFPGIMIKLEALNMEGVITALVTLCAVLAIALGIVWLFLRKESLLFTTMGVSGCYLIGRNSWKFRSRRLFTEN